MTVETNSPRHDRITALFLQACGLPPSNREDFLRQQCADDPALMQEIMEMISYDSQQIIVDEPLVRIHAADIPSATAESSVRLPEHIGQYEVLDVLGQGGMGTVYRARQRHPDRVVALKVIQCGLAFPATIRRFELEASVLGRLHHPGIAQIYEAGTADTGLGAQPYFAMELVTGHTLLTHVKQQGLSPTARLEVLAKICDAVQHAHQHGIVHRDLKPGNVIVETDSGQPKILDFGVARVTDADLKASSFHTREGQLLGTLPYMSPEQMCGDSGQVDHRSDVYSLGVIAYELLSGLLPHDLDGKSVFEAARIVESAQVTRLSVVDRGLRGDVETMVTKAMEKDPARRYQTAAEFSHDICCFLHDQPIAAQPPTTIYQMRKFARRNQAVVVGTAVAVTLLITAVIGTSYGLIIARAERDEARRAADKTNAVRQFILGVLATPAPGVVGRDVKVVDALLAAEMEIAKSFPHQPELRADVLAEMAITLARLGEYDKAEQYARESLQIRSQTLGETHIDTIKAMNDLGNILITPSGKGATAAHDEARRLLDHAITLTRKHHQDRPDELIDLLSNRASLANNLGQPEEAEQLTREMLDLAVKHAGADSLSAIGARQNLAMLLGGRGEHDLAALELGSVAQQLSELHGDRNPATLKARRDHAMSLHVLKRNDAAEAIYRQNIPVAGEVLGKNHIEVVRWLNDYAFLLKESGRYAEAVDTYRDALRGAEASLGPANYLTIATKDSLCISLIALDRVDEAEPLLRECVAGLSNLHGPSTHRHFAKPTSWSMC